MSTEETQAPGLVPAAPGLTPAPPVRIPTEPVIVRPGGFQSIPFPGLLPVLAPPVITVGGPRAGSQQGSIFRDNADPALSWYLPGYALAPDPDPGFGFAATQDSLPDGTGGPANQAVLSLTLEKVVPADVQAAQQASPAARFQEIPLAAVGATVVLNYTAADGSSQQTTIPAQADPQGSTLTVTAQGLVGSAVILAFVELTTSPGVSVDLSLIYEVVLPRVTRAFIDPVLNLRLTATSALSLDLGLKYAAFSYRPRYTLTAAGSTGPIVSVADLQQFNVRESEYIEFTALGDVATAYPSLRALYLGQFSGTIVAVPAAYGILRTAAGCAATCDVVVDASTESASGCRFAFSFTLGPSVDATDLARLALDIAACPDLKGRQVQLILPSSLDSRTPPALETPFASSPVWGTGLKTPNTFLLALDAVDDDQLPAIAKANMLMQELSSAVTPTVFGTIAVKLDDIYQPAVLADVVLNLHTTAGSDGLAIDMTSPTAPVIVNYTPLDLLLTRYGAGGPDGMQVTPLNQPLGHDQSTALTIAAGTEQLVIDRALLLPSPMTPGALGQYVTVTAVDVQQVHHVLGVDASGVDFALLGITAIGVQVSLDAAPEISVPALTLTASRPIDSTAVEIPVSFALTGLAATVTITVTGGDPGQVAPQSVRHQDFIAEPILELSRLDLAPSPAPSPAS